MIQALPFPHHKISTKKFRRGKTQDIDINADSQRDKCVLVNKAVSY